MRSYIGNGFIVAAGFMTTVTIVVTSSLACAGPAQVDKATDKDSVTAEQCIDNKTPGSVEPFEDALVQEGVVNADLDKIRITHGMCDEIIKRTPSVLT